MAHAVCRWPLFLPGQTVVLVELTLRTHSFSKGEKFQETQIRDRFSVLLAIDLETAIERQFRFSALPVAARLFNVGTPRTHS